MHTELLQQRILLDQHAIASFPTAPFRADDAPFVIDPKPGKCPTMLNEPANDGKRFNNHAAKSGTIATRSAEVLCTSETHDHWRQLRRPQQARSQSGFGQTDHYDEREVRTASMNARP